jgi:type IV secretion/conjugal transfer VirB4 family ATPase
MMRLARIFKDYQDAGSVESLVNLHAEIDARTFLTKSGDLMTVLKADAVDFECLEPAQLDHVARRFEKSLRTLDERFRVYQYLLKRSHPELPAKAYNNPVLQQAIASRAHYLKERAARLYSLEIFFVIVYGGWRPAEDWRSRLARWATQPRTAVREALSVRTNVDGLEKGLNQATQFLAERVNSLLVQLQDVLPLTVLEGQPAFRFFRQLLNYSPEKVDAVRLKYTSFIGFQAADSTLECHRDHLRLDDYYVHVLTLKQPPDHSFAHLLRELQEIPSNFIVASEWRRHDNAGMRRLIQGKRRHFHNSKASFLSYVTSTSDASSKDLLIDDSAVALTGELGRCLEEIEVNGRTFGQFSMTVVLYSLDRAALQRATAECFKVFAIHDARVVEERYNQLNAWLAVLPGNHAFNLRRLWLLDTNYADLSFLFGQRTGEVVNTHLGTEHLAVLESESGTPYFLNLHYQDVAHSIVLGATGSGKSFLLNFLITHLQKYNPLTFIFDLGGGYETLTHLFGGAYTSLRPQEQGFSINLFCLPLNPENLHFQASFCRVLIESSGYTMTAADEKDLLEQIESVYAVDPDQRRLLTLANIVNRNLRSQLYKWVEGGPYARWFDNVSDTVTLARFQTFDFEGLSEYPQVLEPLLFYILHRASVSIDNPALGGAFKVFILDEAWRFFRHPVIKPYIIEALKTWRKKNAAMILATQSVDDLRQSALLDVVVESCPTKLFLANPGMDRAAYRDIFHLNEVELERIAGLIPKQQILIKRPDLAKVVNLNVDRQSYWLFTHSPSDNQKKREAFARHGLQKGLEILANLPEGRPGDTQGVTNS